jgi:hypothetical protein
MDLEGRPVGLVGQIRLLVAHEAAPLREGQRIKVHVLTARGGSLGVRSSPWSRDICY